MIAAEAALGVVARLSSGEEGDDWGGMPMAHGRHETSLLRVPDDCRGVRLGWSVSIASGPDTILSLIRGKGKPRPAKLSFRMALPRGLLLDIIGRAVMVLILVPAGDVPSCLNVNWLGRAFKVWISRPPERDMMDS